MPTQPDLFGNETSLRLPPSTRYQGSKRKLVGWIWDSLADIEFDTALDAFGGTGSVSYMLKDRGKRVTFNDSLTACHQMGTAMIENSATRLGPRDIESVLTRRPGREYGGFIEDTFGDIYFTDDENHWLDTVCQNIPRIGNRHKRAIAYFALFQSCMAKRPYNLFHRKNLYMRTSTVSRSFGNKATWDKPFEDHFRAFVREANGAVFESERECRAVCKDACSVPGDFDLVYIDPPYLNARGIGVDYREFYHFLDGACDYKNWPAQVDYARKHRPMIPKPSRWSDPRTIYGAFAELFECYRDSILVVSYRSDGVPGCPELCSMLRDLKGNVRVLSSKNYKYVLSKSRATEEILLISE